MKVLIFGENDHSIPRRYWETSIPMLVDRGIDVHFATIQSTEPLHRVFNNMGITATAFGGSRAHDYPRITLNLTKLLRKEKFDIVHASEAIAATIAGLACLGLSGTKCVFHYHHIHIPGKQRFFSKWGSSLADVVMNVSEASRQGAMDYDGVDRSKSCVAYNGTSPLRDVAEHEVTAIRDGLGIPQGARVIALIARLRPEKGHLTLFEAANVVARSDGPPIHIIVAGDGPERSKLEIAARSFANIHAHFVGNQEDVAPWFASGDIAVVPSYLEPFGLVAIEAMSIGMPVIASRVGGLAEIIDDRVDGLLVPPGDVSALAGALDDLFNDPAMALSLGANARKTYLRKFTTDKMVEGWIRCYKRTHKDQSTLKEPSS